MGKWRGGEMEREIYSLSMSSLSHHCISIFSFSRHFLSQFSHSFSISFPFSYYLAIFSLPLHFFIFSLPFSHSFSVSSPLSHSLTIFSLYFLILSLSSFSHSFSISSPFSYSLVIFSLFLHFQKCSPVPLHFLIKILNLALLIPNCPNKDVFSVLLFAGRLNLRHLSRVSQNLNIRVLRN